MNNLNNEEFDFLNDENNEQEQEQNKENGGKLFYMGASAFLIGFYGLTCAICSIIEGVALVSLGNTIVKTTKKRKRR